MKRGIGLVLVGLGAFLLVLAVMLRFWVVPAVAKAPISPGDATGGVTQTDQGGMAVKLFDPATLTERTNVPLTAIRFTRGDVQAAETSEAKSQDLAIYDSFLRVSDDAGVVVDASTIRVAFNRVSSELTNCCGVNNDGEQVTWTGINPLKFPMFVQQQDYPYFDTTINAAPPALFQGVEDLEGLQVYKFVQTIEPTQTSEMEVPGDLVGSTDASFMAPRFYSNIQTMWVDPTTGSIVKGISQQKQVLRGPDGTDQLTIIEAEIGTDPAEVTQGVNDAKALGSKVAMLQTTVPIVAAILGIVLLVVGFLLARRPSDGASGSAPAREPVGADA